MSSTLLHVLLFLWQWVLPETTQADGPQCLGVNADRAAKQLRNDQCAFLRYQPTADYSQQVLLLDPSKV